MERESCPAPEDIHGVTDDCFQHLDKLAYTVPRLCATILLCVKAHPGPIFGSRSLQEGSLRRGAHSPRRLTPVWLPNNGNGDYRNLSDRRDWHADKSYCATNSQHCLVSQLVSISCPVTYSTWPCHIDSGFLGSFHPWPLYIGCASCCYRSSLGSMFVNRNSINNYYL